MNKIIIIVLIIISITFSGCTQKTPDVKEIQETHNSGRSLTEEERIAQDHYKIEGKLVKVWKEDKDNWGDEELCIQIISEEPYDISFKVEKINESYLNSIWFEDDSHCYSELIQFLNKDVRIYYWFFALEDYPRYKKVFV